MMHRGSLPKALIIGLLLAAVGFGTASCGGGIGGALVDLMEQVPDEATSFVYWDAEKMEGDSDLHQLLDKWKADNEARLAGFSIRSDGVDHFSEFSMDGTTALVVSGEFELNEIRQELENQAYDDKDYKLVEVWESPDEQDWLAVTEDSLIGGAKETVKESIRVIKGEGSLYDDQDARDIMDRLPSGLLVHFQKYVGNATHTGLVASGDSFEKKDKDTLKIKLVYKFVEPEDATSAMEDISEEVDEPYDRVHLKQDGRYVIVTAEVEIEDMIR